MTPTLARKGRLHTCSASPAVCDILQGEAPPLKQCTWLRSAAAVQVLRAGRTRTPRRACGAARKGRARVLLQQGMSQGDRDSAALSVE